MYRLSPFTIIRKDRISATYIVTNSENPGEVRLAKFIDKSLVTLDEFLQEEQILQKIYENGGCNKGLVCLNAVSHMQIPTHYVLITQPIRGMTLHQFYKEGRMATVDYECIKHIMAQILKTIGYMHETLGIGNRNLDTDSILIDPETLDVTIIDFGYGCMGTSCEKFGDFSSFSSPVFMLKHKGQKQLQEQIARVGGDQHLAAIFKRRLEAAKMTFEDVKFADIFSIGVIFWHMLFCSFPYTRDIVEKLRNKKPVDPESLMKNIIFVLDQPPPQLCEIGPKLTAQELKHLFNLTTDILMCGLQHRCDIEDFDENSADCSSAKKLRSLGVQQYNKQSADDYKSMFEEYKDKTKTVLRDSLQSYVEELDKKEPSVVSKEIEFVSDNYTLVKRLGSGGQGSTQMVRDKRTDEYYILKLFKKEVYFKLELKNLRKINKNGCLDTLLCFHRQVVDDNTLKYGILTKVFDGITVADFLYEQIRDNKTIGIENLVKIMTDLLSGLDYLHNTVKIAHVDIKPENILIHPSTMKTQIIDFGSACDHNKCPLIVTKMYLSPERLLQPKMFSDLESLKKSDMFSLGLVFYLLANNRFPFKLWSERRIDRNEFYSLILEVKQKEEYVCIQDYTPRINDELEMMEDDIIYKLVEYEDGWAMGYNTRTKRKGMYPITVTEKRDWNSDAQWVKAFDETPEEFYVMNRIESVYNTRVAPDDVPLAKEIDTFIGAMLLYKKNDDETLTPSWRLDAASALDIIRSFNNRV